MPRCDHHCYHGQFDKCTFTCWKKKLQVCDILYQYCSPPKNEEKNFSEMIIEINGYIGNRWLGNVEGNHSLITSLTYTEVVQ